MAASMTSMRSANVVSKQARQSARPAFVVAPRNACTVVCKAQEPRAEAATINRRELMLASVASIAAVSQAAWPSLAFADEEYKLLTGFASPPTSYGGYGGNAAETPRYTFEYPSTWKPEIPNKVEKGTQGVDSRVVAPGRGKDTKAFVISLSRAGEDGARFRLTDLESTLSSFAGADYDLQDAISGATSKTSSQRAYNGVDFYEYDIDSPEFRYLCSIAVKDGKVYALFVRSPSRTFAANEEKLRHIISTFILL